MDNLKEMRWKQRFENYEKAYETFEKYVDLEEQTELERAGIIQLFEMTFELAWKVLKDYLESEGYNPISPKEAIKEAFRIGLISDGEAWLEALNSRNLSSHTYSEDNVVEIVETIQTTYSYLLRKLKDDMAKRL